MKMPKIRARHRFVYGLGLVAASALFFIDPDNGKGLAVTLIGLISGIFVIALAHAGRKCLMDYDSASMDDLFKKASESSTGAGLALIATAIMFLSLALVFSSAKAEEVPPNAIKYIPVLKTEITNNWSNNPAPHYLASLVEQESCVSLKSKSCWSPTAELKTSREQGVGFGQITRAFNSDGTVRFDALADMRNRYPGLHDLNWATIKDRPDLQLRSMVLMSKTNFQSFVDIKITTKDTLAFSDAAYNGGAGGVKKDRQLCYLTKNCNPSIWFGNVALTCTKSRTPLYGHRSACDINRDHVNGVLVTRHTKYLKFFTA